MSKDINRPVCEECGSPDIEILKIKGSWDAYECIDCGYFGEIIEDGEFTRFEKFRKNKKKHDDEIEE